MLIRIVGSGFKGRFYFMIQGGKVGASGRNEGGKGCGGFEGDVHVLEGEMEGDMELIFYVLYRLQN